MREQQNVFFKLKCWHKKTIGERNCTLHCPYSPKHQKNSLISKLWLLKIGWRLTIGFSRLTRKDIRKLKTRNKRVGGLCTRSPDYSDRNLALQKITGNYSKVIKNKIVFCCFLQSELARNAPPVLLIFDNS